MKLDTELVDYILDHHTELIPMDEMGRLTFHSSFEEVDDIRMDLAQHILAESRDKIFFNYCPACGKLARTPMARQCRCGHSWREEKEQ